MQTGSPVAGVAIATPAWWYDELARLTHPFRERLAEKHEDTAALHRALAGVLRSQGERTCVAGESLGMRLAAEDAAPLERVEAIAADVVEAAEAEDASARWHADRAKGQRQRFATFAHCKEDTVHVTCGCGHAHDRKVGCGVTRLCAPCAGERKRRVQARFGEARARALWSARRQQLFRQARPGGRWTEKLLTVTVPHFGRGRVRTEPCGCDAGEDCLHRTKWTDVAAQRIDVLLRAWRFYRIKENAHWRRCFRCRRREAEGEPRVRKCDGCKRHRERNKLGALRPLFHRAFEWTAGSDLQGHPHLHVWCFGPFLDKRLIGRWLREAFAEAGLVLGEDEPLIWDLKLLQSPNAALVAELFKGERALSQATKLRFAHFAELRGARGPGDCVIEYAVGWTLATFAGSGIVGAETFARVYEALEGKRQVQATTVMLRNDEQGWTVAFLPAFEAACLECGRVGEERRVRVRFERGHDVPEGPSGTGAGG